MSASSVGVGFRLSFTVKKTTCFKLPWAEFLKMSNRKMPLCILLFKTLSVLNRGPPLVMGWTQRYIPIKPPLAQNHKEHQYYEMCLFVGREKRLLFDSSKCNLKKKNYFEVKKKNMARAGAGRAVRCRLF